MLGPGLCSIVSITGALLFLFGNIVQHRARHYAAFVLGRVLVGFGEGTALMCDPLYVTEISPKETRGLLVTVSEVSINIGILLAHVVAWMTDKLPTETHWHWLIFFGLVLPVMILVIAGFLMPETPRFLMMHGREEEAKAVLDSICVSRERAATTLAEIKAAATTAEQKSANKDGGASSPSVGYAKIFCHSDHRLRDVILLAAGIALLPALSGVGTIAFAPFTLRYFGFKSEQMIFTLQLFIGILKLVTLFLSAFLVDGKVGRRGLLLISTLSAFFSHGVTIVGAKVASPTVQLIGLLGYT